MTPLRKIITTIINGEHGWSVSDQFERSFDGEAFEEQNMNALGYIKNCLRYDVIKSGVFNDEAMDEINEYYDKLVKYLEGAE